jgi:histone H2A
MSGKNIKSIKAKATSRSSKAGLKFPVGRVSRILKKGLYAKRIGGSAGLYMAAMLECLCSTLLDMSSTVASEQKKTRITPQHIRIAVDKHKDFARYILKNVLITNGGVSSTKQRKEQI